MAENQGAAPGSDVGSQLGIDEHELSVDEICQRFQTDPEQGLTGEMIDKNREKYGRNKTTPVVPRSLFYRIMKHILHGVSSIMVSGAIVSFMAFFAELIGNTESHHVDLENLFLGLVFSTLIAITGLFSYLRDKRARTVLRQSVSMVVHHQAKVIREGVKTILDSENLVVGDLVELKYGDEVPADLRVIQSIGFKVDSAPLTGLSKAKPIKVECTHSNPLITSNLLYSSTFALEGFCRGIVFRVGDQALIGRITRITSQLKVKETPLSKDVTLMVLTFTVVGLIFAMFCWVAALRLDYSWSSATVFFVGVCVAIVPESLLAAITVCHSVAGARMMKRGCIAKKFESIENLGSTSVLCIDKTGTLTQNKLTVCFIWAAGASPLPVIDDKIQGFGDHHKKILQALLRCIVLTSKATIETVQKNGMGDIEVKDGEPADVSLLKFSTAAYEGGLDLKMNPTTLHEVPFNYRAFHQLSIHLETTRGKSKCRIVVRGAPERVFRMCSTILLDGKEKLITEETKGLVESALNAFAMQEGRVFGFCEKLISYDPNMVFNDSIRNYPVTEYRFLGLTSLTDPPRPGASEFIGTLRSASIKVVMLTGDHPATATSVATSIGLISQDETKTSSIITDVELRELVQSKTLGKVLMEVDELVFARLSPEQKAIVVETFQREGELVTMVGDGVNDCAAMRAADTSVALGGISSVAIKQTADIVILDNSLVTLVSGIEEGRLVFENMKKCFAYTIASNIPVSLPFLLFLFLEFPLPVSPVSIILIAILVDLLPAVALAYEPAEWDLMKNSNRAINLKRHKLFSAKLMERSYARIGIVECVAAMFSYTRVMVDNGFHTTQLMGLSRRWYSIGVITDSHGQEWTFEQRQHLEDVAQTAFYWTLAVVQLAHLLGCKTHRESIFRVGFQNWRLIVAIVIPLTLTLIIIRTDIIHFIETSRIESIPLHYLYPALPFAIHIFLYDEFRRLIFRKFPNTWFGQHMGF